MTKNSIVLMLNMLALTTASIYPMSEDDKREIRKELYANYEIDQITVASLSVPGLTLSEIIDRDIQILSEHKAVLQKKIDFCKGSYMRWFIPFMGKLGIVFTGSLSAVTGLFAAGGFQWCKKIYNDGDVQDRWYNWFVDTAADWDIISLNEYYKELKRFELKEKAHPGFTAVCLTVPVAAAFSAFSGLACISCLYNVCKHPGAVNACLSKFKKQMKRDHAIIVQLKEIKHTLAI